MPDEEAAGHAKDTQVEDPAAVTGAQHAAQHVQHVAQSSEVAAAMLPGAAPGAPLPKKRITPISLAPTTTVASALSAHESVAQLAQPVQLLPVAAATAQVAKKRRITPQSIANAAPAGVAATHPAPAAIELTFAQLHERVDKHADALAAAAAEWGGLSHAQLLYADLGGLDDLERGVKVLRRSVEAYHARTKEVDDAAREAETRRQKELVPVKLDPRADKAIYRKFASALGTDHKTLWRCPCADADGVCRADWNPAYHCKPAPRTKILKHVDAQHLKDEREKELYKDYQEGIEDGWIE